MNEDRLVSLLSSLRGERMDRTADQQLRTRLESAWAERRKRGALSWRLRRPALVLATGVLLLGLSGATLRAGGDSPLYSIRVTLEDLAIPFHTDPEDRAEYLVWLLGERQAEAARLEATGNALAAGKVRAAEQNTLRIVRAELPVAPDTQEEPPSPTPTPTETPSPSPSPTPSPTPTVAPTATPRPATPVPTPVHTPTPAPATVRPATAPPTATGSPVAVVITGTVKNPDGTLANAVCVELSTAGPCLTKSTQGSFKVTISAKIGQTVTLYFLRTDTTKNLTYKASVTVTIKSNSADVGTVLLHQ